MNRNLQLLLWGLVCLVHTECTSQTKPATTPTSKTTNQLVGGGCDGCELMYAGMPAHINATDTSAGWLEKGQKLLVTGTVYQRDGKTPAPNVIIYYWQTDATGYYSPREGMDPQARRHGHLRGWVKTDQAGKYALYTIRPAPYPNEDIPAHIHTSIKEPAIDDEYYIDEFVFDDDRLLTGAKRKALENRGGSGVLRVLLSGDLQVAEHNIVLGLNIPNYPNTMVLVSNQGSNIGEDNPSFIPYHAWGPDKGYPCLPGVQVWPLSWLGLFCGKSSRLGGDKKVAHVFGKGKYTTEQISQSVFCVWQRNQLLQSHPTGRAGKSGSGAGPENDCPNLRSFAHGYRK